MQQIKIAAGPGETLGRPDGLKTAGPIASAAILRLVNEALDRQHGMIPALEPVGAQAAQAKAQHARGQVRVALPLRQNQKAAVIDDQTEAAGPLARAPANPLLSRFEVQRGGAKGD